MPLLQVILWAIQPHICYRQYPTAEEEMLLSQRNIRDFVSEVVFCSESKVADVKLTYYSSECEVDFCGHGTVAAMVDIIRNDVNLSEKSEITVETNKKGLLTVYNRWKG
jgi:predicted PhzF superfamily epimerase YddE/YHI9